MGTWEVLNHNQRADKKNVKIKFYYTKQKKNKYKIYFRIQM